MGLSRACGWWRGCIPNNTELTAKCKGRVPILLHPSFYRALKLRFPGDVGGIAEDGIVSTELGQGSLGHAVGILTQQDFRPVIDTD